MARKAPALVVHWNKDLSLTVYTAGGGKSVLKVSPSWVVIYATPEEAVSGFCEGWFGSSDRKTWRVRVKVV